MKNLGTYKSNFKNTHFETSFIEPVEVKLLKIKKDLVENEFKK
tara:strand:+ start:139 stop:267 length:129 start_codon:yes stop_codon:yes gene_type:complete